ncbi:Manganese transport system membrane protein MntB [archaeon HR01]|nr:Manganese transport system membrane protein MntB [archaeon HR01]
MIEPFTQSFMLRALAAAAVAGFLLPLIGCFIVPKKLSLLGDSSSHFTFAALAIGALAGVFSIFLVYLMAVVAVLASLKLIRGLKISGDQVLAIFLSLGAAVASIALSLGARINLNSVLFGSILVVQPEEILAGLAVAALAGLFTKLRFGEIILYTVNEELARVRGVPVTIYELVLAVVAGLSIVSGIKIAGVLLVTALMVIPTASTSFLASSMKRAIIFSVLIGELSLLTGVVASYYLNIAPGAVTVFILLGFLTASIASARLGLRL